MQQVQMGLFFFKCNSSNNLGFFYFRQIPSHKFLMLNVSDTCDKHRVICSYRPFHMFQKWGTLVLHVLVGMGPWGLNRSLTPAFNALPDISLKWPACVMCLHHL